MDPGRHAAAIEGVLGSRYANLALEGRRTRGKRIADLLNHRRMPEHGWDDLTLKLFLEELASMDCNNDVERSGVGEREGRIFSRVVAEAHHHFAHGIGRSGDISELQPKAPGSSLINVLTSRLALHALHILGLPSFKACTVLPVATGMSLSVAMGALRRRRPPTAKYVLWSRIDQKSCFKSIGAAGFYPLVVPLKLEGHSLTTDLDALESTLKAYDAVDILCVMSTTSTFAPRTPDDVVGVAKLCARFDVPHVVNHAYGIQCGPTTAALDAAARRGRVDFVVMSTDKNFLVPVGGGIVCSPREE
eukprot:GHVU01131000.1.p1 GENE.GHVU01131000.1~~GHVU01131000.1.p1  ORF type:complete len:304 (+),score=33.44 GHVU01131000.1:327-1238(+)